MPHNLMDELFETDSYDVVVDWARHPDLELEPEEYDVSATMEHFLLDAEPSTHVEFNKAEPDQRLATGWANVLTEEDGSPMFDREGDSVEEHELVSAVEKFMRLPREQRLCKDTHRNVVGTVVESLVVTKALKVAMGLPEKFPTGWLATVHVTHDPTWALVKSGEYTSFSMGGSGVRIAVP